MRKIGLQQVAGGVLAGGMVLSLFGSTLIPTRAADTTRTFPETDHQCTIDLLSRH